MLPTYTKSSPKIYDPFNILIHMNLLTFSTKFVVFLIHFTGWIIYVWFLLIIPIICFSFILPLCNAAIDSFAMRR